MKQENSVKIVSEDKKIFLYADVDTTLGSMHDFLLSVKGDIVDRITKSQEEEAKAAKKVEEENAKKEAEVPTTVEPEVEAPKA